MRNIIFLVLIVVVVFMMFNTFTSEHFLARPQAAMFGSGESDRDDQLIKQLENSRASQLRCDTAKNRLIAELNKMREDIKNQKNASAAALQECKVKVSSQLDKYKKLFKTLNNREPTADELNELSFQ